MTGYSVVIEHEGDAWGAYVPDLPGCVAAGSSRQEVESRHPGGHSGAYLSHAPSWRRTSLTRRPRGVIVVP